jgi:methionyl-tRNA formyltransferase
MRIVFFGTPDYVIPILKRLNHKFQPRNGESPIVAVVTQQPRPSGRKGRLKYSSVDEWAHKKKLPIFFDANELVKENFEADVGVLASYGEFIPKSVINHFKFGILNIHPSLLPKWRGASPVQASIISGDQAGVSIIKLNEELDHGPIISQFKEDVSITDTTETLRNRLFERSAEVLATLIPAYTKGKITLREQDHKIATFTRQIKKEDAHIPPQYLKATLQGRTLKGEWDIPFMKDFTIHCSPTTIHRFIRAMQPWPIAWTEMKLNKSDKVTKRLKLLESHLKPLSSNTNLPSTKIVLDEVQLESKNPVTWEQFREGYPDATF